MNIDELFKDKTIKAKGKVKTLGDWLFNGELPIDELLAYAGKQKPADKATCIEAIELATKKTPAIADEHVLFWVTKALKDKEPRIKWESARVIGNIARLFPANLGESIKNLLQNTENPGTVVRWATAHALAEILKLKTDGSEKLLPKIESLYEKEEDNGVRKIYLDALKNN